MGTSWDIDGISYMKPDTIGYVCIYVSLSLYVYIYILSSESVGFQSLGPGTGETKMHAPKNWNSPGTLLEPFAVGLQNWVNLHGRSCSDRRPLWPAHEFWAGSNL